VIGFFYLILFLGILLISGLLIEEFMVIGAITAGIICNLLFPDKMAKEMEKKFQFLMMFISPFFFYSIGYKIDFSSMINLNLIAILIIICISIISRILSSIILFRKKLGGIKQTIVFGFGLCAKFSTSVVILALLVDYGYISIGIIEKSEELPSIPPPIHQSLQLTKKKFFHNLFLHRFFDINP